ncbi:hypothetical protein [Acinetobacter sp.]|uniref:hypothetical protein n=1 Tax=Acinetobacter sp. TaxID=472 RepID=UPI002FC9CD27
MKFSFNIDIALLITIFTTFLFWCGYWYSYGYAEFFGVSISFFDLAVSTTIIDGLLVGVDKLLTFLVIITSFLFITTYSRKDFEFVLGLIAAFFAFVVMVIRFKIFKSKPSKYKIIPPQSQLPLFPQFRIKQKKQNFITKSKSIAFAKNYLKKNKMTLKELSEDIYGNNQPGNTEKTAFNVLAFYALLLIFVGLIYFMFYVGWTLQKNGWDAAQNYYELNFQIKPSELPIPTVFPKFIGKEKNLHSGYRLTNICNQNSCFAVDIARNVKLVEIKEIVIQNGPVK